MKLLVLTAFYPIPNITHERMFVHVRNRYYFEHGINVTVLNFSCSKEYLVDGIRVISLEEYKKEKMIYDILICHSANIRNHYIFLKKYVKQFNHIVFFFHGHEIMYLNKDYPEPYEYMRQDGCFRRMMQNVYDYLKVNIWKQYYLDLVMKSEYVFVSDYLYRKFIHNTKLKNEELKGKTHIINNSIGSIFENCKYNWQKNKEYDFITIRSNLDGATYCIDKIIDLAEKLPQERFLIIGKGRYFEYNKKPDNVEWISETINHEQMCHYLDVSCCGLQLTKHDTQGVMTCEFAAYGIPTITSDIEVCHEVLSGIKNVGFVPNDVKPKDLVKLKEILIKKLPYPNNERHYAINTTAKEIELFNRILNNNG